MWLGRCGESRRGGDEKAEGRGEQIADSLGQTARKELDPCSERWGEAHKEHWAVTGSGGSVLRKNQLGVNGL